MATPDAFTPPGYMELYDSAVECLRNSQPARHRALRKAGEPDAHIDRRING